MKNLSQLGNNLEDLSKLVKGIEKLNTKWILTRTVIDCNEILINEEKIKKEQSMEQYSKDSKLLKSFIDLHNSIITNYTSRKDRAHKLRSKLYSVYEIMDIQNETPYGKFLYSRKDWDLEHDMSLEDFSQKHAVIY